MADYGGPVPSVPMFPLNAVVFPGVVVPLHIFEDRYRALVRDLLTADDPGERVFGIVAIREGYEVGDHGVHSAYRVGTLAQLTAYERYDDGRFDIEVVGRQRLLLNGMETSGEYFRGDVDLLVEESDAGDDEVLDRARAVHAQYREIIESIRGEDVLIGELPRDPEYLSYTLAASSVLPLADRQNLLEADSPGERLERLIAMLRAEIRAMRALPSLPATELARTRWSPN